MRFSSFLPRDTRTTEFISAWALISFCILCSTTNVDVAFLLKYGTIYFWTIITGLLGVMQLLSVGMYPKTEVLRVATAWMNGTFWVWLSLTSYRIDTSDIGVFFLGLANLYAFCINALMLRTSWEN